MRRLRGARFVLIMFSLAIIAWLALGVATPGFANAPRAQRMAVAEGTVSWSAQPAAVIEPAGTGETEPNNGFSTADTLLVPSTLTCQINSAGDVDYFKFTAVAGRTYSIEASGTGAHPADPAMWHGWNVGGDWWVDAFGDDNEIARPETTEPQHNNAIIHWACPTGGGGVYYLRVWSSIPGNSGNYDLKLADEGPKTAAVPDRVTGADRYAIAREIARRRFPVGYAPVHHVIIASGLDRAAADPLTASSLAGVYNAPILLINQDSATHQLPTPTKSVISAIRTARGSNPTTFCLVGGTASVPSWVQTRVKALFPLARFQRIAGADRYECSANIAKATRVAAGSTKCFFANGETSAFFYDALAAGSVSFNLHYPILLVKKNSVPPATLNEASHYGGNFIVGNTYEVSNAVKSTLGNPTRIGATYGSYNRRLVARMFAEEWGPKHRNSLTYGHPVIVNKLADSLTGGTLAGYYNSPLLYTHSASGLDNYGGSDYWYTHEWLQTNHPDYIHDFSVIGGEVSIEPQVFDNVQWLTGSLTGYP